MRKIALIIVIMAALFASCEKNVKKIEVRGELKTYIKSLSIKTGSIDIDNYSDEWINKEYKIKTYVESDYLWLDNVLETMQKEGYHPSTLKECLAYIKSYPDRVDDGVGSKYPIMALGSKYVDEKGLTHIPVLKYGLYDAEMTYGLIELVGDGNDPAIDLGIIDCYNINILGSKGLHD